MKTKEKSISHKYHIPNLDRWSPVMTLKSDDRTSRNKELLELLYMAVFRQIREDCFTEDEFNESLLPLVIRNKMNVQLVKKNQNGLVDSIEIPIPEGGLTSIILPDDLSDKLHEFLSSDEHNYQLVINEQVDEDFIFDSGFRIISEGSLNSVQRFSLTEKLLSHTDYLEKTDEVLEFKIYGLNHNLTRNGKEKVVLRFKVDTSEPVTANEMLNDALIEMIGDVNDGRFELVVEKLNPEKEIKLSLEYGYIHLSTKSSIQFSKKYMNFQSIDQFNYEYYDSFLEVIDDNPLDAFPIFIYDSPDLVHFHKCWCIWFEKKWQDVAWKKNFDLILSLNKTIKSGYIVVMSSFNPIEIVTMLDLVTKGIHRIENFVENLNGQTIEQVIEQLLTYSIEIVKVEE